ncbi:TetR/AcrR family transcriptional regulator [Microbacterium sp.]|uniref:TetR/AcrR family transcriptional regulator n=1 Tax=Microbacterium sp. TaxID=51671 RepID=UPI00333ED3D4
MPTSSAEASPPPTRKEAILAAAERVFAEEGYDRATLRTIAAAAGVKLSLLVYHFESKAQLYRAVFERHQHINEERREQLRGVDLAAGDALEQIVDAFLHTAYLAERDAALAQYFGLVLREASDPSSAERTIIRDLFDPMAREFIAALRAVLPDKPEGFHRQAYLFAVGALTLTANDARERELAGAEGAAPSRAAVLRGFLVAALRGG